MFGRCGLRGNKCAVVASEDCANSDGCRDEGLCAMGHAPLLEADPETAVCMAVDQAACRRSAWCKLHGNCELHEGIGMCWMSADGCKRSEDCRECGRCSFELGRCVAVGKDCQKLEACAKDRRIRPHPDECSFGPTGLVQD